MERRSEGKDNRALFWDLGRVVRSSLMLGGVNNRGGVRDSIGSRGLILWG